VFARFWTSKIYLGRARALAKEPCAEGMGEIIKQRQLNKKQQYIAF